MRDATGMPTSESQPTMPVDPPPRTMTVTAAADAPVVMPRMSGLASGFRVTDWVSAPEMPRAEPTRMAVSVLGMRQSKMTRCSMREPPLVRRISATRTGLIG